MTGNHTAEAPVVVQKYGGTSVATAGRICQIAERVSRCLEDLTAAGCRPVGDGEDNR